MQKNKFILILVYLIYLTNLGVLTGCTYTTLPPNAAQLFNKAKNSKVRYIKVKSYGNNLIFKKNLQDELDINNIIYSEDFIPQVLLTIKKIKLSNNLIANNSLGQGQIYRLSIDIDYILENYNDDQAEVLEVNFNKNIDLSVDYTNKITKELAFSIEESHLYQEASANIVKAITTFR